MRHQVLDGDGEVVVGVQQPDRGHDDPVAVGVGVVAKRQHVVVLQSHERRHGVRARAVHADLAIVIDGHEREGGIQLLAHDVELQLPVIGDALPIGKRGAAQRVDSDPQPDVANGRHVEHAVQSRDIGAAQIGQVSRGG